MQQGKDNEEQEGKPDTVRSQGLGQDGRQTSHRMNLPCEALRFLYPMVIIAHVVARSQDDVGRDGERIQSGIRS